MPARGEADEDVGAVEGVLQRPLDGLDGELRPCTGFMSSCRPSVDDAGLVDHAQVLAAHAVGRGRACAQAIAEAPAPQKTTFDVVDLLADDLERVQERRRRDDRRAVLVVVEDRDLEPLLQRAPRSRSTPAT